MRQRTHAIVSATLVLMAHSPSGLSGQLAPANAAGVSIAAVYLTVADPQVHANLWRELFHVEIVPFGAAQLVKFPGVFLVLERGTPTEGSNGASVDHEGFLVPSYLAAKDLLTARGVTLFSESAENKQVTFTFPDGVKIEFSEAADLRVPIAHHHIHMFVPNRESVRDWYVRAFGAVASARGNFISANFPGEGLFTGATACAQESGDFRCPRIDFANAQNARPTNTGRAIGRIGLEVRGLDEFVRRLAAQGIAVEGGVAEIPGVGVRRAVITDPMGTRIELTEGLAAR
jgi:catechol 2,3-dioxygenase-like lactoylglutathione lyase family enzyme